MRDESANAVDTDADARLDSITETARRLFGTQSAAVTIVGSDEQRVKSAAGISSDTIPRADAICNVTIRRSRALVIENLSSHREFRQLPWVAGEAALRFYAGYPLESASGHRVGALCIMDPQSRRFSRSDTALLRELAFQAQAVLNS
jgi:GAF domain-containing protein